MNALLAIHYCMLLAPLVTRLCSRKRIAPDVCHGVLPATTVKACTALTTCAHGCMPTASLSGFNTCISNAPSPSGLLTFMALDCLANLALQLPYIVSPLQLQCKTSAVKLVNQTAVTAVTTSLLACSPSMCPSSRLGPFWSTSWLPRCTSP